MIDWDALWERKEYKEELRLDLNALDTVWQTQPALYMKYAVAAVEAQDERDHQKRKLEVLAADLDHKIRRNPDKFEIKSISNPAIAACVDTHPSYDLQYQKYLAACRKANMYMAAMRAFDHRRASIEGLTKLWLNGYYSSRPAQANTSKAYFQKEAYDTQKRVLLRKKGELEDGLFGEVQREESGLSGEARGPEEEE